MTPQKICRYGLRIAVALGRRLKADYGDLRIRFSYSDACSKWRQSAAPRMLGTSHLGFQATPKMAKFASIRVAPGAGY